MPLTALTLNQLWTFSPEAHILILVENKTMRNGSKRSLELFTNEVTIIIIIKLLIFSHATKEIFKPIIFRFLKQF